MTSQINCYAPHAKARKEIKEVKNAIVECFISIDSFSVGVRVDCLSCSILHLIQIVKLFHSVGTIFIILREGFTKLDKEVDQMKRFIFHFASLNPSF